MDTSWIPRKGKDRLGKVSLGEERVEEKDVSNETSKKKKFVPPTLEELDDYCYEHNLSVDPQEFIDFYDGNGWMVGKNHMKDWKATARNWDRRRKNEKTQGSRFMTKREQAIKDYNDQLQMMADWARGDNVND